MTGPPPLDTQHLAPQQIVTRLCRRLSRLAALRQSGISRAAVAVVGAGLLIRIVLIFTGWPASDSDESTMGIMALHIAGHTDLPIFFYGQRYMGALEAYLAAEAFQLFGPSLVALRIGMALMATLWLIAMYRLARSLYAPSLALFACALLAVGPPEALYRELWAGGGYGETLLFGTLLMLLAAWLARTSANVDGERLELKRLAGFAGWGLAAGLGLWSDTLILPFVLTSGVLLVLFCWREWRLAAPSLLVGLALGALPLLIYAISGADHNPFAGALAVQRSSNAWSGNVPALLAGQVTGTLLVALPTITGGAALCPLPQDANWPLSLASPQTLLCTGVHGAWGLGYVALLVLGLLASIRAVRRLGGTEDRTTLAREAAHLALLASAALTLLLFMSSPVAARSPNVVMRYLIGLLVALPAVLAPLWSMAPAAASRVARVASMLREREAWTVRLLLGVIALGFVLGLLGVVASVPAARATNLRQAAVAAYLEQHGTTRVYSDYWTCGWLIFQSRERVICAALDAQLRPDLDRYLPYRALLHATARPAYIFPLDSAQAATFAARLASAPSAPAYTRATFQGFVIYRPVAGEA